MVKINVAVLAGARYGPVADRLEVIGHPDSRVAARALDLLVFPVDRERRESAIVVIERGLLEVDRLVAEVAVTRLALLPGPLRPALRPDREELALVRIGVTAAAPRLDRLVANKRPGARAGGLRHVAACAGRLGVLPGQRKATVLVVVKRQVGE